MLFTDISSQRVINAFQKVGFWISKTHGTKHTGMTDGKIKGNIDADLVLCAALELYDYDKAVIVSSDGDFYSLVQHLYENHKLEVVLSPDIKNCSNLLKQTAKEKIWFMNELRNKLEYKKKSTV